MNPILSGSTNYPFCGLHYIRAILEPYQAYGMQQFWFSGPLGKATWPLSLGFLFSIQFKFRMIPQRRAGRYYSTSGLSTLTYIDFSTVEFEMVIVTRIRKVMQIYKYSYFLDALSLSFILYFNCTQSYCQVLYYFPVQLALDIHGFHICEFNQLQIKKKKFQKILKSKLVFAICRQLFTQHLYFIRYYK